jgi:hypothetical protein
MSQVVYVSDSELATLTDTFAVTGTPTDPTTVSLAVTDPNAVLTTYTYAAGEITKTAVGAYRKTIPSGIAGTWSYTWTATGTVTATDTGSWVIASTDLGNLYFTVASLKSRVGISQTDVNSDAELHGACYAASRAIETYTDRTFYQSASQARTFIPQGWYELSLPAFCELVSISELATDDAGDGTFETVWAASDYQLLPVNPQAAPETRPYNCLRAVGTHTFPLTVPTVLTRMDRVRITGTWGWPAVPNAIRQAVAILAAETFRLKDAPFGVAGFGEFGAIRIKQNPMVEAFAAPYQRYPIKVA